MPNSLESRVSALETQDATTTPCPVLIYEEGVPMPELPPGDGVVILLPNNHREDKPHGNP